MPRNSLHRSQHHKLIAGVCGGLAEYFDIDPVIVRVLFILFSGAGIIGYIILWIVVPKEGVTEANPIPTESQSCCCNDTSSETGGNFMTMGLLLIAFGVVLLINNLVPWFDMSSYWPVILIIFGLGMLTKRCKK